MKKYVIPSLLLFILLIFLIVERTKEKILWIQGNTNISILRIIWILLLVIIIIEVVYIIYAYKIGYLSVFIFVFGFMIGGSVWLENESDATRYYYEENGHQILVDDSDGLIFGDITFYYKYNSIFSKEFASCRQNSALRCSYYIEDGNLIIELNSHGDIEEKVYPIPTE